MCSAGAGLRRNAMQNANPLQAWDPLLWVPLQWSPKAYPIRGSALVSSVHLPDTLMLTPCTQVAPGRSYIFNSGLHSSPLGVLSTGGHSCILCQPLLVYLSVSLVSHLYTGDSNPHLTEEGRSQGLSSVERGVQCLALSKALQCGFFLYIKKLLAYSDLQCCLSSRCIVK